MKLLQLHANPSELQIASCSLYSFALKRRHLLEMNPHCSAATGTGPPPHQLEFRLYYEFSRFIYSAPKIVILLGRFIC